MEKIRVGLWGIGRSGYGMHTKEIQLHGDMAEIVACHDIIPERMEKIREIFPLCRICSSAEEMLNDPDVELITVALRSPDHVEAGIRALEAGKMTMVDKPIALNSAEAQRLREAGERHPGKLFFRQTLRFEPAFQHVREIVESGILGNVFEIKLRRQGFYRRCDWQSLKHCGGGILNNWGPHLIDHALQFLNYQVADVWGDTKILTTSGDAEDHFHALLRGPTGLVVDISVSGAVALPEPEYSVYGDRGSLVCENNMKSLHLNYLDIEKCTPPPEASDATPPLEAGYRPADGLVWIDKHLDVSPAMKVDEKDTYRYLYRTIREGKPYPIRNEGAFENVRISDMIRARSQNIPA